MKAQKKLKVDFVDVELGEEAGNPASHSQLTLPPHPTTNPSKICFPLESTKAKEFLALKAEHSSVKTVCLRQLNISLLQIHLL